MGIIGHLINEESGQGMAEYAMIFMVVVIVCLVGYQVFGNALSLKVNDIAGKI